jgi:hypothetical protein
MEKEVADAIALTMPISNILNGILDSIKPDYLPKRKYRIHREIQFYVGDIEFIVTYYPIDDSWADAEIRLYKSDTDLSQIISCGVESDMILAINKDFEDWRNGE